MAARTSLDGGQLITCKSTRQYDEKNIPQNDFDWVVDLKAQMKEFAEQLLTVDFDYGLHLMATLDRNALSTADLSSRLLSARSSARSKQTHRTGRAGLGAHCSNGEVGNSCSASLL